MWKAALELRDRYHTDRMRASFGAGDPIALVRPNCAHGPRAGNLAAVPAECHLLDEVGNGLAKGDKSCLHVAVWCDVRHAAREAQRLREAVVQIDLEDALRAGFRQRRGAAPDGAERIEAHRRGRGTRAVSGEDLADEIEQDIHLALEAREIGGV